MLGSFKVSSDDENTPADGEMSYEQEVMRSVEATRALVRKAGFKSTLHVSPTSNIVENFQQSWNNYAPTPKAHGSIYS